MLFFPQHRYTITTKLPHQKIQTIETSVKKNIVVNPTTLFIIIIKLLPVSLRHTLGHINTSWV